MRSVAVAVNLSMVISVGEGVKIKFNQRITFICIYGMLLACLWIGDATAALSREPVRLLSMQDPFANGINTAKEDLEALVGSAIDLELVDYSTSRRLIFLNAQRPHSRYDIIAVDAAWMGELGKASLLRDLSGWIKKSRLDRADFLEAAWASGQYQGHQLGIPIQPHPEILFYRKDLFKQAGLSPPRTIEDVLAAARHFHNSRLGLSGICWNAARGAALGQTMLHFMAAFGQAPFDANGVPQLDSAQTIAAGQYAKQLMRYSPPDVLMMAWDERIQHFSQGGCAMTYGWTARSALLEAKGNNITRGKVGYAPAPHATGADPVTPVGAWLLAIPQNIAPQREAMAFQVIEQLVSPEALEIYIRHGTSTSPRYSMLWSARNVAHYPVLRAVEQMSRAGLLQGWMRPPIPEFQRLTEVLGTEFHKVLTGELSVQEAAQRSQRKMDWVMRKAGYYQ